MMFEAPLVELAEKLLHLCRERKLMLTTAESCTGGLIAAVLTSVPGSSDVLDSAIVSYSNRAKSVFLGVPADLIARHGAVSEAVARRMAEGALGLGGAQIAVSVTGIAGPDGGTQSKPVGLVHIATARKNSPTLHQRLMLGDQGRETVRLLSVAAALELTIVQAATGP